MAGEMGGADDRDGSGGALPVRGRRRFDGGRHGVPARIQRRARTKLLAIDAARRLDDLRVPPGNRLEALRGDRRGLYSIRINEQWRACFAWRGGDAWEVEIVDYH